MADRPARPPRPRRVGDGPPWGLRRSSSCRTAGCSRGQVDGGNGHSGKRSPDLHFGLGRVPDMTPLRVDLRWRDPSGRPLAQTLDLTPGWHTVRLAWPHPEDDR